MTKILRFVGGLLFLVACILTANDWSTESGLWGIVASYQLNLFGSFSVKMTTLATLFVWSLPALMISGLAGWLGGGSNFRRVAKPDRNAPPELHAEYHKRQSSTTLSIAAFACALGVVFFGWLTYKATLLRKANVGLYDLETATGQPSAGVRFAQLVGTPHRDLVFTIEQGGRVESHYYPLTSADWLQERPIHFLIKGNGALIADPPPILRPSPVKPMKGAPPPPVVKFSALTETAAGEFVPIPQFVRDAFEKGGITVAADCRMLKKIQLGEKGAEENEFYARIFVFSGLGLGALFAVIGVISRFQMRKFQRLVV